MQDDICAYEGCAKAPEIRGRCRNHYQQLRKSGALPTRKYYGADETCSAEGCTARPKAAGMCNMHRRRLRKHGSTAKPSSAVPWEPRFWAKVYPCPITGCWWWGASVRKKRGGYGQFNVRRGLSRGAHQVAYELVKGPVPDGLVLDHLCRQTDCVNPDHLEAVTSAENNRRGMAPGFVAWRNNLCQKGLHPLAADVLANGRRRCRPCSREYNRARRRAA